MTISFGCPNCDTSLNAPDEYAGGKARCKKCGTKIRIPTPATDEPDPLDDDLFAAFAEQSSPPPRVNLPAKASTQAAPANQPSGQRLFIKVIVGVAVAVLVIAVTVIVLVKHSETKQREAAVAKLNATLDDAIARADGHADRFDFAEALFTVEAVSDEIANRPYASAIKPRLTEELARRAKDKREYKKRIAQGHVVFEGKLIPGKERDRILAERAETLRREKQRRIAEADRRAAAQRQQQEELQSARIRQFVAFVNLVNLQCPISRFQKDSRIPVCFIDEALRESGYDPQFIWIKTFGTLTFEGEDVPRSLQLSAAPSGASDDFIAVRFGDKWHPCQLTYVPPRISISITVGLNEFEGRMRKKKSTRAQKEDEAAVETLFRLCVGALADFEYSCHVVFL